MGPTSPDPLAAGEAAGKALRKVPCGQRPLNSPLGSDRGERLNHETSVGELRMRDVQASRAHDSAAPVDEVEVEDARTPTPPAPTPKFMFDYLSAP